jgi:23S rRNA (adenine2503-C2)-methyltransferase
LTQLTPMQTNLLGLDRAGMIEFFRALGEKPFRATQVMQWIHQHGVTDFAAMSNLSKTLRARLHHEAVLDVPQIVREQVSHDGTRKWLLQLADGNCIETVFIPEDDRATLCVSSQVGCALNCSFCATARQGFNRNLSVAEIIAQLWLAEHRLRSVLAPDEIVKPGPSGRIISNIVFMGMGEPLLNYDNLLIALRLMLDDYAYGLSWRRLTVSSAGVVPMLDRLHADCPVSLAISLHAVRDDLRDTLVPLNRKYPIAEVLAACKRYVQGDTRRRITFEYALLKDVNDSRADAKALIRLLNGLPAKVNLIPFNDFPQSGYTRPSRERVDAFRQVLMDADLITVTRKTRGDDIDAACGQLAGSIQDRTRRSSRVQTDANGQDDPRQKAA